MRRRRDRARQLVRVVRQDAEIGRGRAEPVDQPGQQVAVGVEQRRRRARPAGFDDFVAGREHRHPDAAAYRKRVQADAGRERDMLGGQPPPGRQHDGAGTHVFARNPPVGAALEPRRHDHRRSVRVRPHVLLHEDGIGALRHRRAGEDAGGLAGPEAALRRTPRGDALDDGEPRVALHVEIGVPHRVAVDRRIIERRQVDRRHQIARKNPSARGGQWNGFDLGDRNHAFGNDLLDLRHRQQGAGERKAVVGELRHQPRSSSVSTSSRAAACRTITSAMRSTSSRSTTGTVTCGSGTSDATATIARSSG